MSHTAILIYVSYVFIVRVVVNAFVHFLKLPLQLHQLPLDLRLVLRRTFAVAGVGVVIVVVVALLCRPRVRVHGRNAVLLLVVSVVASVGLVVANAVAVTAVTVEVDEAAVGAEIGGGKVFDDVVVGFVEQLRFKVRYFLLFLTHFALQLRLVVNGLLYVLVLRFQ